MIECIKETGELLVKKIDFKLFIENIIVLENGNKTKIYLIINITKNNCKFEIGKVTNFFLKEELFIGKSSSKSNKFYHMFKCDIKINKKNEIIGLKKIEDNAEKLNKIFSNSFNIKNILINKKEDLTKYIKGNNIKYAVFHFNNKNLFYYDEYKKHIEHEFFKQNKIETSKICSICNTKKDNYLIEDFTKYELKFFINDKINFSEKLQNYYQNCYSICKNCFYKYKIGEVFLINYGETYIGKYKVMIFPKLKNNINNKRLLYKLFEYIKFSFNLNKNIYGIYNLENYFFNYIENINIMFYHSKNNEFKILKFIKDISPSYFSNILYKLEESNRMFFKITHIEAKVSIGSIYYLFPIEKNKRSEKFINIIANIFMEIPIESKTLIPDFVKLIRIWRYENNNNYNIGEFDIKSKIIEIYIFLSFLNNLYGGNEMDKEYIDKLKDEISYSKLNNTNRVDCLLKEIIDFAEAADFCEQKFALFNLGVFIGFIAKTKDQKEKKRPILNKINFNGMSKEKIKFIAPLILQHSRIYKVNKNTPIFDKYLNYYNYFSKYFSKNENNWTLDKNENVFYIMSGVSFAMTKNNDKED